ncbi:MAG TPA: hypothetical protein VKQ72_07395 [Aggregatilineales bacterium]|nr:hypothetical protein [Aggregatilineales bacterium]
MEKHAKPNDKFPYNFPATVIPGKTPAFTMNDEMAANATFALWVFGASVMETVLS